MKYRIQEINTGRGIYWHVQKKGWFRWTTLWSGDFYMYQSFEAAEIALNEYIKIENIKYVKTIKEYTV